MTFSQPLGADNTPQAWMNLFTDTPNLAEWKGWMGAGLILLPTPRNTAALRRERTASVLLGSPKSVDGKISANIVSRKERERVAARRKERRDARLASGSAISHTVPSASGPPAINAAEKIHEATARATGVSKVASKPRRALTPSAYPRDPETGSFLHMLNWEREVGVLPPPHMSELHHIDGNPLNADTENLVLMSIHQHRALHGKRAPSRPWYANAPVNDTALDAMLTTMDEHLIKCWMLGLEVGPGPDGVGPSWHCVIGNDPEHDHAHFTRNHRGRLVVFRDYPCKRKIITIAEYMRASIVGEHGDDVKRIYHAPTAAAWLARAAYGLGVLPSSPLPLPTIPARNPNMRGAYEAIDLLWRCRWCSCCGIPVPMTVRFVMEWCHVSYRQAREIIAWLIAASVVVKVGMGGTAARPYALYMPGAHVAATVPVIARTPTGVPVPRFVAVDGREIDLRGKVNTEQERAALCSWASLRAQCEKERGGEDAAARGLCTLIGYVRGLIGEDDDTTVREHGYVQAVAHSEGWYTGTADRVRRLRASGVVPHDKLVRNAEHDVYQRRVRPRW